MDERGYKKLNFNNGIKLNINALICTKLENDATVRLFDTLLLEKEDQEVSFLLKIFINVIGYKELSDLDQFNDKILELFFLKAVASGSAYIKIVDIDIKGDILDVSNKKEFAIENANSLVNTINIDLDIPINNFRFNGFADYELIGFLIDKKAEEKNLTSLLSENQDDIHLVKIIKVSEKQNA